jgi:phosphatidylserine synthase
MFSGKCAFPQKGASPMKKKYFRGIPAPFHAAVVFAVFFSLLGSPASKSSHTTVGLPGIVAKLQAIFFDRSRDVKFYEGTKNGGKKFSTSSWDGVPDPPPPPQPPK